MRIRGVLHVGILLVPMLIRVSNLAFPGQTNRSRKVWVCSERFDSLDPEEHKYPYTDTL